MSYGPPGSTPPTSGPRASAPLRRVPADAGERARLLHRTSHLWRGLMRACLAQHAEAVVEAELWRDRDGLPRLDDGAGVIDRLLFESEPGRGPLVQTLAARGLDLTPLDRALLRDWEDAVCGVFLVRARGSDGFDAANAVDGLRYRIYSHADGGLPPAIAPGVHVAARLVRLLDAWLIVGRCRVVHQRDRALALAAGVALASPGMVVRNPSLLVRSQDLSRRLHALFLRRFGGPIQLGTRLEVEACYGDLVAAWRDQIAGSDGAASFVTTPQALHRLREVTEERALVAMLSHMHHGLAFVPRYHVLLGALDDPAWLEHASARRTLRELLADRLLPAWAVALAADRDPDQATRLFRHLHGDPGFDWERDGRPLLEERLPASGPPAPPTVVAVPAGIASAVRSCELGVVGDAPRAATTMPAAPIAVVASRARAIGATGRAGNGTKR